MLFIIRAIFECYIDILEFEELVKDNRNFQCCSFWITKKFIGKLWRHDGRTV